MPLTQAPLYCLECRCQQIEAPKSSTLKAGTVQQPIGMQLLQPLAIQNIGLIF
jgi:hypothetical protein